MSRRYIYVGGGQAAKSTVKSSPAYGKVPIPKVDRQGILALLAATAGPAVEEVDFVDVGEMNWVESHPTNGHVYATWDDKVGAFKMGGDGKLQKVSEVDAMGSAHHLTVSPCGAWLLSAGYMSAHIIVFPIAPDGSVGAAIDSKHHQAPMIERLKDRQEQCHPHQIMFAPFSPHWVLSCDLGADCVWVYGFDARSGTLHGALNSDKHVKFPEGSGPRHLVSHPSGNWIFVLCELDSQVVTCDWDGLAGHLTKKSTAYMFSDGVQGSRAPHTGGCAIRIAPTGQFLYTSHRTNDTIVVFKIDGSSGALERVQSVPCGGATPRDIMLEWPLEDDDKRRILRVVNQDGQNITNFAVQADGLLSQQSVVLPTPGFCGCCLTAAALPPPWVANL